MTSRFYPHEMVESFEDIDANFLKQKGIDTLLVDIDNTIATHQTKEPTENVLNWLSQLRQNNIKVCIFSNANKNRVELFSRNLNIPAIHRARKPALQKFKKALTLLDSSKEKSAIIGDQLFTDVYGGKRMGMFTILVKPLSSREILFVKLKRYIERIVLRNFKKGQDSKN